jgi:phage baseplate assembly protein gpV
MEHFLNAMKAQAAALDRGQGQARFGVVASTDAARHAVRVRLMPEGVLSGWLPVLTPWAGAGWGMFCAPVPGTQVLVVAQEGEAEHGVVVGAAFSDPRPPPAASPGEVVLRHQSGAEIRLAADGTVRIAGNVHVQGDMIVSGAVRDHHGTLGALREHYNAHSHPGAEGPPFPLD